MPNNRTYYVKVDVSNGYPVGLLRSGGAASGEVWADEGWKPTTMLVSVLCLGDPSFDEVTTRTAKRLFPAAFA